MKPEDRAPPILTGVAMNSWTIWGYVKRPESKVTTTGKALTKFCVSVPNEKRGDQDQKAAGYTYVEVTFWGDVQLAEGDVVMCHGSYYNQSYEKKDGTKGYSSGMTAKRVGICQGGKVGDVIRSADTPPEDLPF